MIGILNSLSFNRIVAEKAFYQQIPVASLPQAHAHRLPDSVQSGPVRKTVQVQLIKIQPWSFFKHN